MGKFLTAVAMLALMVPLAGCGDGQPLFEDPDDGTDGGGTDGGGTDGGGIGGDPDLPPGTTDPTAQAGIVRFEAADDAGGGYASNVSYDALSDTFTVDNIAFDGANVYNRDATNAVRSIGGYAVFESEEVEFDPDNGLPVTQLNYRALYGVSTNTATVNGEVLPRSQFAIVRTGDYVGYGFGGFVYERNGGVVLPETGFATYSGSYAGIRVFQNLGGLEYTRGTMVIDIDFDDFNTGNGVKGTVTGREAFDIDGNPIALGGADQLVLPDLNFVIGPGVMTTDGEITSGIQSQTVDPDSGALEVYEEGTYFGIIGGANADEIVGVIVVESEDPRYEGVTAQETGGFIVYR